MRWMPRRVAVWWADLAVTWAAARVFWRARRSGGNPIVAPHRVVEMANAAITVAEALAGAVWKQTTDEGKSWRHRAAALAADARQAQVLCAASRAALSTCGIAQAAEPPERLATIADALAKVPSAQVRTFNQQRRAAAIAQRSTRKVGC